MTDDAGQYRGSKAPAASHETVAHSRKEYVRGNVHTNTVEGFFSIFKRGVMVPSIIRVNNICNGICTNLISAITPVHL
jgi:hypothetical protein